VPTVAGIKELKRALIERHVRPDNLKGFAAVFTTLVPVVVLWAAAAFSAEVSYWLTAAITVLMTLFLLRVFVLMHECGHGSLFRTARLNNAFGFIFGVVAGLPQYVWSQHHHYHHSTNGNWSKYRGPLSIIPVDEYAAMTAGQQRRYRNARSIWLAPIAGFFYCVFNPRVNWLKGSAALVAHLVRGKLALPGVPLRTHAESFKTPYWSSPQEYWHMFWNNVVLLALWGLMAWAIGPALFFACYVASVSLAGGVGILVFTVQHNFEHSYASHDEGWDYDRAAIEGTSFLVLPGWLNWFTANIAYHHVHHLSARIPSYCLVACHDEYRHLFTGVTRIRLAEIPRALKYILWDTRLRHLISVAEYQQRLALRA
jgi:omega-6 fatty acid desaturase (delta-12 desaturase)